MASPVDAELVVVNEERSYVVTRTITDMSPLAVEAAKAVADAQYAVPARQESVRVGIVVAGVIAITFVGHLIAVPTGLLIVADVAVAGVYGLPKIVEKIKGAVTKDIGSPSG